MKYIVYQTTNKENGKLYIGVHKTENPDIFDGYIGNGIYVGYSLNNPKTVYQHALKKYGYSSFIRTTLKVFDNEDEAYNYEAQLVTLDFIRSDNNYNTKTGGIHGSWNYKKVYQFDLKGELIKVWDSVTDVIEYYDIADTRITSAITNKYNTLESYWSFNESINVEEYRHNHLSELYQYSFKGDLIKVYKNIPDCAEQTGYSKASLQDACFQKKKYKECYWVRDPEIIFEVIKMNSLYNLEYKPIIQYDKDMNIVQEFITISKASIELGYKYDRIKSACRTGCLVDGKYYFKYVSPIKKNKQKVAQYTLDTHELVKVWDSIAECAKIHPKCRDVVKGARRQTHGYTFEYVDEKINDIV